MLSETFNKKNLDDILKALAKEYRKLVGKQMPAEIILIGGAAVIENYGFRDMTTDIDALITAASAMKDAINNVGDSLGLSAGWLNDDFKMTESFSSKLREISVYYKSFYGVLNVRTVSSEYLIAMKLKSGRKYKHDLSDIVGILAEHKKKDNAISSEEIKSAAKELYGSWDSIPDDSRDFLDQLFKEQDYESIYNEVKDHEKQAHEILVDFDIEYPNTIKTENVDSILKTLIGKKADRDK